jgi:sulfofructose kinase
VVSYPALPAEVVDSNGAGDVFHGAFAYAYTVYGDFYKCCIFSSAVSALKCMGIGARESVPDLNTVINYLKENGYEL